MAADSAVRWEFDSQARCQRLTARGKPHKAAMEAVMRRLACLLNTLLREDRLRQAEPPCPALQAAARAHRPAALDRNSPFGWSCATIAFPKLSYPKICLTASTEATAVSRPAVRTAAWRPGREVRRNGRGATRLGYTRS